MPVIDETQVREACALNARLLEGQKRAGAGASADLDALLGELRRTAALPLERARTLPAGAYTDEAFHAWELAELFRKEWFCVAHVSQLPENGDFVNLDAFGEPLMVVRGKDGAVRVLSRACPHRGMDIMPPGFGHDGHGCGEARDGPGCGHARMFLCPYHSWTFDLDGRLKGAPEMQQAADFDRREWSLREFRSEVWEGFVFVNLDGDAGATVAERFAELLPQVAPWRMEEMRLVMAREWEIPCNWKVLTENFMESYHHAGAHARTLQTLMPAKDTWTERERPYFVRSHLPYKAKVREEIAATEAAGGHWDPFPPLAGLDDEARHEWGLVLGFPLFTMVTAPDQVVWYRIVPDGPDAVKLLTTVLVPPATLEDPDFDAKLERASAEAVAFHLEDVEVIAAVQRSLYASGYQRGRLSHLEMPIWLLQRYLAARSEGNWPALDGKGHPGQR